MHLTIDPITGVPFVVTNCALCHAERLRWQGGEALVDRARQQADQIHAYDCAFAAITTAPASRREKLGTARARGRRGEAASRGPSEYRDAVRRRARVTALRQRAAERFELHARTRRRSAGPRRHDRELRLALARLTSRPVTLAPDVGWAKSPRRRSASRVRTTLSWDGSQEGPIDLLVVEADSRRACASSGSRRHPFQGASLGAYLRQPTPRPAFPRTLDRKRAPRGKLAFDRPLQRLPRHLRADGRVIDYREQIVLTSPTSTPIRCACSPRPSPSSAPPTIRTLTRGYNPFPRSTGYVPPVLTNVWARAPYGHAGQWPSLAVLAIPPGNRAELRDDPEARSISSASASRSSPITIRWCPASTPRWHAARLRRAGPSVPRRPRREVRGGCDNTN